MRNDHYSFHRSSLTGQTTGEYAKDFGRFAPYFRNYNIPYNTHSGANRLEPYHFGTKLTSGPTYYKQTIVAGTGANGLPNGSDWIDADSQVVDNSAGGTPVSISNELGS